jgi:hypothetical protein
MRLGDLCAVVGWKWFRRGGLPDNPSEKKSVVEDFFNSYQLLALAERNE